MATVDSLDLQIQGSAQKAIQAVDKLIDKIGKLSGALKFDTGSLKDIGKSVDLSGLSKGLDNVQKKTKEASETISSSMEKASDSLNSLSEKYKDLGKDFQFFGDEKQAQKQLERYNNMLEKAKLSEERLRLGGDTDSSKYEKAVADMMQYSNIVNRISKQLSEIEAPKMETGTDNIADSLGAEKVEETVNDITVKLDWYRDYLEEFSERISSISAGTPVFGTAVAEDVLSSLKTEIPEATDLIDSFEAEIERLNNLKINVGNIEPLQDSAVILENAGETVEKVAESISEIELPEVDISGTETFRDKIESVIEEIEDLRDAGETVGLGKSLQGAFAQMAQGIMTSAEIVGQKIRDFKAEVQDMRDSGETIGFGKSFLNAITPVNTFDAIKEKISSLKNAFTGLRKEKIFENASSGAQGAETIIDNVSQKVEKVSKAMGLASMSAEEFDSYLEKLTVPDVLETDLGKLNTKLKSAQQTLENLKSKATNFQLLPGKGTDFSSEGYRKIQVEIAKTEKTIDLLTEKIGTVTESSNEAARESAEAFRNNLANLQIPEIKTDSLEKLEKELQKAEADLDKFRTKLQNDITMGRVTADFSDSGYRKAVEQIALTEKQIEAIKEKMKTADSAAGQTSGYSKLSQAMSALSSVGNRLSNVFAKAASQIKGLAKSIGQLAASGLKKIGDGFKTLASNALKAAKALISMTRSNKGTDKSLKDSIKTILKYTLGIRGMFALVRKLKGAFKEGMDNLVQYSNEVNHSVSLLTSGLLSLKNGLAVAFAPVVNVAAPYLDKLIDLLLSAANAVGRFFAALTGKTVATQAKKVYQDCAESLNGVADAAKDAAKAIGTIGIDELNILSENKEDKDGGVSIEDMFEDVTIERDIDDWAKRIRDAFLNQDWEGLGKSIAELVNSGLKKIYGAITGITPKVEQALKNFASVFNSFVDYLDWDLLGRTIGSGINLVTTAINSLFGDGGIDLENLGRKISTGFRRMVNEIDWTGLGNAIGNGFMVGWRIADGFISDMWRVSADTMRNGWEELGISVGEAVNGVFDRIDFAQIALVLTEGFRGIIEAAANALDAVRFDAIVEKINSGLDTLANGIAWEHVGEQITKFTAAVSKAFNDLLELDFGLVGTIIGNGITDIVRAFNQLTGEGGINFEQLGSNISDGLRNLFDNIPWQEFGNALGNGFMLGWRILDGFISDMSKKNDAGLTGWAELGISIGNAVNGIFDRIDFGEIGTLLSDGFNGLIEVIKNFVETIDWNDIAANLTQGLNNFIHGVNWTEAGKTLNEFVKNLLNVFWEVAQNTDWESLGRGIGEFLSEIDWSAHLNTAINIAEEVIGNLFNGLGETSAGKATMGFAAGFAGFKAAEAFDPLIQLILNGLGVEGPVAAALAKGIEVLAGVLAGAAVGGKDFIDACFSFVSGILDNIIEAIQNIDWSNVWHNIISALGALISNTPAIIGKITALSYEIIGHLVGGLIEYVLSGEFFSDLLEFGLNLIQGIAKGIMSAIGGLVDVIKAIFDGIVNGLKKLFGIHSPSTVMSEIGGFIMQGLINGIISLVDGINAIWQGIKDAAIAIWNGIGDFLGGIWQGIKDTASSIWGGVKDFFGGVWDGIKETAKDVWGNISGFLKDTWDGLKTWASDKFKNIKESVSNAWNGVKETAQEVWGGIKSFLGNTWDNLSSWASEKFTGIKETVKNAWGDLKENASETWGNIKTFLGDTWENIKTSASDKFESIKTKVSDAWENAKEKTSETWENVKKTVGDKLSETAKNVSEKFSNLQGEMGEHGKNVISGLTQGIESVAGTLRSKVQEVAGNVTNWFKDKLGIHSPSTVFRGLGEYSLEGYSEGLNEGSSLVKTQMSDIVASSLKPFDGLGKQFNAMGSEMVSELDSGVSDQMSAVSKMMGQMATEMKGAFSSVASMTKDVFGKIDSSSIAKNLMDGIANGISGNASSVLNKIGSVASSMISKFKSTLGIHSPSKVFYGLAEFTMEGFEQGIDSTENELQRKMSNIASGIGKVFSEEFSENATMYIPAANEFSKAISSSVSMNAVINDGQIISGIEEAAYRGFLRAQAETSPYLQEIADNTKKAADKDTVVRIGDRDIVSAYNRGNARQGYSFTS